MEHPYKFDPSDPEYVALANSSPFAVAVAAAKRGIRCRDHSDQPVEKTELAARVFAVHKRTSRESDWFEPTILGAEYWKPKLTAFFKGLLVVCTMVAVNYGRAYYARAWNCHWPTITNFGGILDTPFCAGLKWVDSVWDGLQKSFVYGGGAAMAYAIPAMMGWRGATRQKYI